MCLLSAGAATSQQVQVLNNQVNLSDVFAAQTLDVVDQSGAVQGVTASTGNSHLAGAVGAPVDVQSTQRANGQIYGETIVNASGRSESVSITTTATGNTAEANVEETGLTGSNAQSVGPVTVQAYSEFNGPSASVGSLSVSTQAVVNSQGLGVTGSTAQFSISQDSEAIAQADNGVTLQYTEGSVISSAIATVNNVTATGAGGFADQSIDVTQTSTGARSEATNFTYAGNAQDITAQATVTANNITALNEGGPLEVIASQSNSSAVNSEAYLSSFQFGSATANAYGVGNSVMAGNFGPTVSVDNTQLNSGGVSATATFVGDSGYDAYSSATAIGNAVTGYACTDCPPAGLSANNVQTNSGAITATNAMTITGPGRNLNATATATGNSASFYVNNNQQ